MKVKPYRFKINYRQRDVLKRSGEFCDPYIWIYISMIAVLNIGLFVLFDLSVNSSWNSVHLFYKFRLLQLGVTTLKTKSRASSMGKE